jgi:O-antigen ligase
MRTSARFLPYPLEWAWLILFFSGLTFTYRTAAQALSGTIDDTNFRRFTFVVIALTIVVLHLKRVPRFRLNPISVFLVYTIIGVFSSLWSEGPIATLGKSMEMLAAVSVVWITMVMADAEARLRRLIYWTIFGCVLGLLYVALGNIFYPAVFHEYLQIRGLLPYSWGAPSFFASNTISQLGALVGLFCLALAFEKEQGSWFFIPCYLVCAVFPVLAQGRTGMASFLVGTVLVLAKRFPISSVFIIPAAAGLAIILFGDTLLRLFLRGEDEEMLLSLTGRTTWWEWGWTAFLSRPWFGSGWGVGSRVVFLRLLGMTPASVHNGLLEVLLGVGLVGFAIWASAVVWTWWLAAAAYLRGDPPLVFIIGMVVPTTATFLSTGIGGWLDFFVQHFLAAAALLWFRQQQGSTRPRVVPLG